MKELRLSQIPKAVFDIVIDKQNEIKKKKGTNQYGFERTLYVIVREWKQLQQEKQKQSVP